MKVTFKEPIKALRGKIDGLVFRQMKDGTVIVSRAPGRTRRKPSQAQINSRQLFRAASAYAKAAQGQPCYRELAKMKGLTAYNVALSDRRRPPVIHQIQHTDGRILVQASDNVMVTKVQVMVLDEQGEVVEGGEGIRSEGDWWEYLPNVAGKTITATAWDLAGNVTKFVL